MICKQIEIVEHASNPDGPERLAGLLKVFFTLDPELDYLVITRRGDIYEFHLPYGQEIFQAHQEPNHP